MKKTLTILLIIASLAGCYSKDKEVKKENKPGTYIGVYQRNGVKQIGEILKVYQDKIIVDSASGEKRIETKELYGVLFVNAVKDSLQRQLKTVSGKDSTVSGWIEISKDSINFKVEGITIDSLLKKK